MTVNQPHENTQSKTYQNCNQAKQLRRQPAVRHLWTTNQPRNRARVFSGGFLGAGLPPMRGEKRPRIVGASPFEKDFGRTIRCLARGIGRTSRNRD